MSRKRRQRPKKSGRGRHLRSVKAGRSVSPNTLYILDQFSLNDIRRWEAQRDRLLKFHADYYNELALQRSNVIDELMGSLRGASRGPYPFEEWYRVLRYKWCLDPLSTKGSLKDPGARFNIGDIDATRFPMFGALYLAEDNETALQEVLCQDVELEAGLTRTDFALAAHNSYSWVRIKGNLESILDLADGDALEQFVKVFSGFKISESLKEEARELELPEPRIARNTGELMTALLDPNWRISPMQVDVPATPQIFGQLVASAGIEGIRYPSKMTGKSCLCIFPQNFAESASFVELMDEGPGGVSLPWRIDSDTYKSFI